ncbi:MULTISPECIES: hypothetical protein [unclassified Methanoculleus]|jgi:hypothetical protein|uniref:DUF1616 domain-containing protein n=1 Tax=Methanoculleus palmolei TaxID=72612 RepID=A0ABD8A9B2_9EURY|nr:hypothetical protein [Methanoculleus sp. UBA377]MDD2473840.1 hypothetical protein [Methanoculleus sp.]WOX56101.1 hypothetical protein R6Y95_01900 [Methanoculleus palmolei]
MDVNQKQNWRTILILLVVICLFVVVIFLLLLLPAFVETLLPNNSYVIEITGLSGLAVNGTATVMIPVPANAEGEPALSEGVLAGERQPVGWQAAIRETPYGKMLVFTTVDGYASDISIPFGEAETEKEPRLLVPVLSTPGNASVAEFTRASSGTYTTVVFLDGFVPSPEDAAPISFSLEYQGGGGMKHLIKGDIWTTTVDTTVPSTTSGFVPVPADYYVTAGGIMLL